MHVVLVEPEIPWNTGNIGRTCVATGTTLHLVGKLGFSLDSKYIRRSGLDYWPKLKYKQYPDFESFLKSIPKSASLLLFSTKAKRNFWDAPYHKSSYLIFGKETAGLSEKIRGQFPDRLYRIPMLRGTRSLNLSTSAAVVLYEALRQTPSWQGR
jgi:tRNA (cytidine/uridine-2'-O-)-methyltransferase